jgi:hypothetical protein
VSAVGSVKMLAVVHKSVAKAPKELSAPDSGSPDCRVAGNEIVSAYKNSYTDAVSMQFDGETSMAFTHSRQSLLRPRYDMDLCFLCFYLACDCRLLVKCRERVRERAVSDLECCLFGVL